MVNKGAYLYLPKGNLKAEAFIKIWVQRILLHRRLLLLQPFTIVLQHYLHKRIWGRSV